MSWPEVKHMELLRLQRGNGEQCRLPGANCEGLVQVFPCNDAAQATSRELRQPPIRRPRCCRSYMTRLRSTSVRERQEAKSRTWRRGGAEPDKTYLKVKRLATAVIQMLPVLLENFPA